MITRCCATNYEEIKFKYSRSRAKKRWSCIVRPHLTTSMYPTAIQCGLHPQVAVTVPLSTRRVMTCVRRTSDGDGLMKLLFLHGPPASGKRTVGEVIIHLTGGRLFDNHAAVDFARTVIDFDGPGFWDLVHSARMAALEKAAQHGVGLVVLTSCYSHPEDLPLVEDFERVLARHGDSYSQSSSRAPEKHWRNASARRNVSQGGRWHPRKAWIDACLVGTWFRCPVRIASRSTRIPRRHPTPLRLSLLILTWRTRWEAASNNGRLFYFVCRCCAGFQRSDYSSCGMPAFRRPQGVGVQLLLFLAESNFPNTVGLMDSLL